VDGGSEEASHQVTGVLVVAGATEWVVVVLWSCRRAAAASVFAESHWPCLPPQLLCISRTAVSMSVVWWTVSPPAVAP
jgi:hypothetical protein